MESGQYLSLRCRENVPEDHLCDRGKVLLKYLEQEKLFECFASRLSVFDAKFEQNRLKLEIIENTRCDLEDRYRMMQEHHDEVKKLGDLHAEFKRLVLEEHAAKDQVAAQIEKHLDQLGLRNTIEKKKD